MADWEDEEDAGRGFGMNTDSYNDGGDQNGNYSDGGRQGDGERDSGARRGGRGRGRGGYGGGRGGGGFGSRYNNNGDGDDDEEIVSHQNFDFVPRDFKASTVERFILEVPERLKTATLVQIYQILQYAIRAYELHVNAQLQQKAGGRKASKRAETKITSLMPTARWCADEDENIVVGNRYPRVLDMFSRDEEDDAPREMDIYKGLSIEPFAASKSVSKGAVALSSMALPSLELSQLLEADESPTGRQSGQNEKQRNREQLQVSDSSNLLPTTGIAPSPALPKRHLGENELKLRKRMARRVFAIVEDDVGRMNTMQAMAYCYFPLDHTLLDIEDASAASVAAALMVEGDGSAISNTTIKTVDDGTVVMAAAQPTPSESSAIPDWVSSIDVARQHANSASVSGLVVPSQPALTLQQTSMVQQPPLQGSMLSNEFVNYFIEPVDASNSGKEAREVDKDLVAGAATPQVTIETSLNTPANAGDSQPSGQLNSAFIASASTATAPSVGNVAAKPSTLPSIREEEFRRTLLRRTMRDSTFASTPLRALQMLSLESRSPHSHDSVVSDSNVIALAPTNTSSAPTKNELKVGGALADISELQGNGSNGASYSRDWGEVLRGRKVNLNYINGHLARQKRRKKRRLVERASSPAGSAPGLDGDLQMADIVDDILPQAQPLSVAAESMKIVPLEKISVTGPTIGLTPPQMKILRRKSDRITNSRQASQQERDNFLLDNIESVTTIMDNLAEWHRMLMEYKRSYNAAETAVESGIVSATSLLPIAYTYDFNALVQADTRRLQIKLLLLQEIIRNVRFDLTKLRTLNGRVEAAIAFSFLLELKSANIITLSSSDHNRNSERGGGGFRGRGGGGRGRGGGGGGGGRGNRNGFSDRNGDDGDDSFNNNKGEGDGEQKPREFYIPPEPTDNEDEIFSSGISSGINFSKYDSIPVQVSGENAPQPIASFSEAGLRQIVLDNVQKSGYKVPTPIQKTAIPVIMAGRDLMACAQTGSGKTAAFLLPIINGILSESCDLAIGKPQAVIVSPTRELAIQIFNEARKFSLGSYLKISIVYGGTSSKHQGENIAKGCHVLICTPGRLLDFVEKAFITFEETRYVVLDEADRMMDMGFKENVNTLMNHPTMRAMEQRQNLMFSATFPEEIQRLAGEYLSEYIFITIGVVGGACSDVTQSIFEVKKFQKRAKLMELLAESSDGTIVFVETKRGADFLASLLSETEFPTTSIHGDRLQRQREMALADFKSGKMKVLIATSVAARGLDIKNVSHVVNYDMPSSIDEYVHRIGRTGRVGNNGRATSFFDPEHDSAIAGGLVKILEGANQDVPDFLRSYASGGGGYSQNNFGGRDVRKDVQQSDNNFITSAGPSALEEEENWG